MNYILLHLNNFNQFDMSIENLQTDSNLESTTYCTNYSIQYGTGTEDSNKLYNFSEKPTVDTRVTLRHSTIYRNLFFYSITKNDSDPREIQIRDETPELYYCIFQWLPTHTRVI